MSPERRSIGLAILGGMMAISYLDSIDAVDLSLGFARDGLVEGAILAMTGALAGYAVLLAFRKLRDFASRDPK